MPVDRLVIANMKTGYETDRTPFIINNDAFPVLNNAYIWRGRLPRKRGTILLGRLQRNLVTATGGNYSTINGTNTYLIFTRLSLNVLEPDASVKPLTLSIVFAAPISQTLNDTLGTGVLTVVGAGPIQSATINYATGVVSITANAVAGPAASTITLGYYPDLPVMGLEDFDIGTVNQPVLISFDTRYSYGINQGTNVFYDTTFYKSTHVPFTWNGGNFQQFYSTNYLGVNTIADVPDKVGCLWVTNSSPGFHFKRITAMPVVGANSQFTIAAHGLSNTDYVFINEVNGVTGVNGVSGLVTVVDANNFTIPTPGAAGAYISGGIAEYMTRSVTTTADGIRWYDGDPTVSNNFGWVNFAPPLNEYNASTNPNPFYLVGADIITPFKNRLIFSGVYLTTTAIGAAVQYFPNRIVYSQVGTPFYSQPLPFPIATQAPQPDAWFQNVAGKGGFLTAPFDEEIITVAETKDVLIYGLEMHQLKLIYTLDDSLPFIFQTINSELGSQNTFSAVTLDTGVLSIGDFGILMTTEFSCQRIDLQIPDEVFSIAVSNNNNYRVTAVRDFRNEWVYFTYCPGSATTNDVSTTKVFNSKTLLYNYRDNNWATFDENYTHYGTFRRTTNRTWASLGSIYGTWANWTDPWNFGANESFFPQVVGGNQHGFVLIKGQGTNEGNSQFISAVTPATFTITSPNHCLSTGDFIKITGMLGITVADESGNPLSVFRIRVVDSNNFIIDSNVDFTMSGTYLGGGVYKRYSRPFIQTKQFPMMWDNARGIRVGTQHYLLQTTASGEITAQVYSSQNSSSPANEPSINSYLAFQDVVLTSPEPDLYGANPAYSSGQQQIWHRQSNSFNGSTVQMGFTLSDEQMFNEDINTQEIILHAIVLDLYPGPVIG